MLLGRDVLGAERYIGWVHGVRGGDVWAGQCDSVHPMRRRHLFRQCGRQRVRGVCGWDDVGGRQFVVPARWFYRHCVHAMRGGQLHVLALHQYIAGGL